MMQSGYTTAWMPKTLFSVPRVEISSANHIASQKNNILYFPEEQIQEVLSGIYNTRVLYIEHTDGIWQTLDSSL